MKVATSATGVELSKAPQGGEILVVGARVRNLRGCTVHLSAALIDPETKSVIVVDQRPVFLEESGDGWLTPKQPSSLINYSNVAACPNAALTRPVNGFAYNLKMTVTDSMQRVVEAAVDVTPTCGAGADFSICQCSCAPGYRLNETCDGGDAPDSADDR